MAIPYRAYGLYQKATLEAYYTSPPGTYADPTDWTTENKRIGITLGEHNTGNPEDWHWRGILRPWPTEECESEAGMDALMKIETEFLFSNLVNTAEVEHAHAYVGILDNDNAWIHRTVTGRHYNGVDLWDDCPPLMKAPYAYPEVVMAQLPKLYTVWNPPYFAGVGNTVNNYQADFFRNGLGIRLVNLSPGSPTAGEKFTASCNPLTLKAYFFNPVVNSISVDGETRFWMLTAGGVEVIFTGLGFDNSDTEIDYPGTANPNGWKDAVDEIYFVPLMGQTVPAALKSADGDFTVDSNTQITIPAGKMPALEEGSYSIRLVKVGTDVGDVEAYAGDWTCPSSGDWIGSCWHGTRMTFLSTTRMPVIDARPKRGTIFLMRCDKKARSGGAITKENWSLDDVRSPLRFYEGIVTSVSGFRRGIDDRTGMFKMADLTITLANHDKKFSKLLAEYSFKNQMAQLFVAFLDEPEAWKAHVVSMIVQDYNIKGTSFEMKLKDLSQKYFDTNLPSRICAEDDTEEEGGFPDIHPDYIGRPMPEILGTALSTEGEDKGAIEAVCIDTVGYRYLAAARALTEITHVYSDNVLQTLTTHYTVTYGINYTYIDFVGNQSDSRITFNAKGYQRPEWNSTNGYIQNPAYVIGYFLINFLNISEAYVDMDSIEDLADQYEDMDEELSGKLLMQETNSASEWFRQLLFSFGAKCWVAKDGRFTVGRKSLDDFDTDVIIFEQHDILSPINREMGLTKMVNAADIKWDYIPAQDLFKGAAEAKDETLIDLYDKETRDRITERPPRSREDRR